MDNILSADSKSIYGLKQAGTNWNKLLDKWMTSHGLVTGSSDPCLYTYKGTPEEHLMMVIYVDDILISSNSPFLREQLLREMGESFKLTILGQAKWILGMQVSYKPNGAIQIDQEKYLQRSL